MFLLELIAILSVAICSICVLWFLFAVGLYVLARLDGVKVRFIDVLRGLGL